MDFGSLLGPTLRYVCDFSVIWDAKVGDSFQVHVFDDPGMECWLNAVALCARTTIKPVVFEWFHFFTYSLIWCPVGGIWLTFSST